MTMKHRLHLQVGILTFTAAMIFLVYVNFGNPFLMSVEVRAPSSAAEIDDKRGIGFSETSKVPTVSETPKRHLPNAIIAGCAKCGTRALLWLLSLHPDVKPAGPEIHFFDRDENYQNGFDWYKKFFPPRLENQIGIEKSPSYFVVDSVPKRVYDMNSSMKIIVIVCEPVKKVISRYAQLTEKPGFSATFEKFILNMSNGKVDQTKGSVRESTYAAHLKKWLKWFPLKQILFLDGDHFKVDPVSQLNLVEDYLGIPRYIDDSLVVYNKTKGFHCLVRNGVGVQCLESGKGRPHPDIDPALKQKLADFFAPLNKEFLYSIGRLYNWNVWN